jgi:hypothetical protein
MKVRLLWTLGFTVVVISEVSARQYVYPARAQSPQQQKNEGHGYTVK